MADVSFERPPVVEVALGVQFEPIEQLSVADIATYWMEVRDRFPRWREAAPIPPAIELFGPHRPSPPFELKLHAGAVPNRALLESTDGTRLLQVQRDRFLHNWRRTPDGEYPRYAAIRHTFSEELTRFRLFVKTTLRANLVANQCEVTYVNHIPAGSGWENHGQAGRIAALASGKHSDDFLPEPEAVEMGVRYLIPGKAGSAAGRLHVVMQPSFRASTLEPLFNMTLTARGRPRGYTDADILHWLDLGHDFVIRGFRSFTTTHMHGVWGLHAS